MQRLCKQLSVISAKTLVCSVQKTLGDGYIAIAAGFSFGGGVGGGGFCWRHCAFSCVQSHCCLVWDKNPDELAGKPLRCLKKCSQQLYFPLLHIFSGYCSSACWIYGWNIQTVLSACLEQDTEMHLGSCSS